MKIKSFKIHNWFNFAVRRSGKFNYLEIGAESGLNCRLIRAKNDCVSNENVHPAFRLYQYECDPETFFDLICWDLEKYYDFVFLRDWNEENLEERILKAYRLLSGAGAFLVLENFDPTGEKNDTWKISYGLKKAGIKCKILNEKYLAIEYGGEIESISVRTKKSTFKKSPEKYLP